MTQSDILHLARHPFGYLAPMSETIAELHEAGLINIPWMGDGYVIVKAVPVPCSRVRRHTRWELRQFAEVRV